MILVALIVALGGFVWGFDATVISGAVPFIQKYFGLNGDRGDFLLGLAVSSLGWGVLGGTAVAGFFSDRFGRKKVLITTAVFFVSTALALRAHNSFRGFCHRPRFSVEWRSAERFLSRRFILRRSHRRNGAGVWCRSISS